MNSDGMVEGAEEVENGTVTRYWWILVIIPLGLIIGTVTSTCNHLQADLNKDDLAQYRVSEEISKKPLTDDMQKAYDMPDQAVDITLKGISSSNGLNHYLKLRTFQTIDSKYGYYDVVGKNKSEVLALIVPLDESNPGTILSHPALDLTAENSLTDQKINLTFQAAQQLRKLLLDKL